MDSTSSTPASTPAFSDLVGVADGGIENGEKVVYEYDAKGELVAWHKEPVTLADKVGA